MKKTDLPEIVPLIPLRDMVVFPKMLLPVFIGRSKSKIALGPEPEKFQGKHLFLATQKDDQFLDPSQENIYSIGTLVEVLQVIKLQDGNLKILVEGIIRGKPQEFTQIDPYFLVRLDYLGSTSQLTEEIQTKVRICLDLFERYIKLHKKIPLETLMSVAHVDDPNHLADLVCSYLTIKTEQKQSLLETLDLQERLSKIIKILDHEINLLNVEDQLHSKVKNQLEKVQKEYYLKEKLKAIQEELGHETGLGDSNEFQDKLQKLSCTPVVEEKIKKEIDRLSKASSLSAEAGVIRNYLDWVLEMPWKQSEVLDIDIQVVKALLDQNHFGLEKVKERILEYLSVYKRTKKNQATILCLSGPPGVGKTSIVRSVAEALGRPFTRVSLAGIRDQAELRGHRKTYVGAMPGRIIQAVHRVKSNSPVFLLDEVDKMSASFEGDPSAVLLEILDPEQNKHFYDHYLELEFDLSQILFIATANQVFNLPKPLLDRFEVIPISGYTDFEKVRIAQDFLVPKQLKAHGFEPNEITVTKEQLLNIIRDYTQESGLRNLDRSIAKIFRKTAKELLTNNDAEKKISDEKIKDYLGKKRNFAGKVLSSPQIGVATGLAWTESGGDLILIETSIVPGKGQLHLTGRMGEVMQESAQAALTYIRSKEQNNIDPAFFRKNDLHIHIPEGAIPKDGPSAGVTLAVAIYSAVKQQKVRHDVAMTGEITLSGRVLPVGGIKEKLLAAERFHLKEIFIPKDNEQDLDDLPQEIRDQLKIHLVEHLEEIIEKVIL